MTQSPVEMDMFFVPNFLTEKGKKLAKRCKTRHQIILQFLRSLGVSPQTAAHDAEGIEHHISDETLAIMAKLTPSSR